MYFAAKLRLLVVAPWVLTLALFAGTLAAADTPRISGPVTHDNLSIYFIHGASRPGPVPLTLQEAMAQGVVQLHETGNVNLLEIENSGKDGVFVQAGDIVKGGQQDRTLMVSLLLPPRSGRVQIASFCVEQGRWAARGKEDVKKFATSAAALPSREMKLAMQSPEVETASIPGINVRPDRRQDRTRQISLRPMNETASRQTKVWDGVRKAQQKLGRNLGASVEAQASATSLQLALESEKLKTERGKYVATLAAAGEAGADIVGYVFAVNGKINSADVYPSNGLFRKMWRKQLDAAATEAIGERADAPQPTPSVEQVQAFLEAAEAGTQKDRALAAGARVATRDSKAALYMEAAAAGGFVHRNYLSK
jgi:hypothetical protein